MADALKPNLEACRLCRWSVAVGLMVLRRGSNGPFGPVPLFCWSQTRWMGGRTNPEPKDVQELRTLRQPPSLLAEQNWLGSDTRPASVGAEASTPSR